MTSYFYYPELAGKYGSENSLVLSYIVWWVAKNAANRRHIYEGKVWMYNSISAFREFFFFWTDRQLRTRLEQLEKLGAVVRGNFNQNPLDRTGWYALSDECMAFCKTCETEQNIRIIEAAESLTKVSDASDKNVTCICTKKSNVIRNTDNTYTVNKSSIEDIIRNPENVDKNVKSEDGKNPRAGRRRTSENNCLFADSRYSGYEAFAEEFTAEEFRDVDLVFYYNSVADWSAGKGVRRKDWIATARNFIRRDRADGKVRFRDNGLGMTQADYDDYRMIFMNK